VTPKLKCQHLTLTYAGRNYGVQCGSCKARWVRVAGYTDDGHRMSVLRRITKGLRATDPWPTKEEWWEFSVMDHGNTSFSRR